MTMVQDNTWQGYIASASQYINKQNITTFVRYQPFYRQTIKTGARARHPVRLGKIG